MQHYFINKEHSIDDFFEFEECIAGQKYTFLSCDNIFSKSHVDLGTLALLKAIDKHISLSGHGLDFGCGYGVIGIYLMKNYDVEMDLLDVNATAIHLSRQNVYKNGVRKNTTFIESDGFAHCDKVYDFIISNPPIKVGKAVLFKFLTESIDHLRKCGSLTIVVRKDAGMESCKKHLLQIYGNCEIIMRDKGYYILHCQKTME